MKAPSSEMIGKVIENLEKVLPVALTKKDSLNMSWGDVDYDQVDKIQDSNNVCNTTLCHGGWYAAAIWNSGRFKNKKRVDFGNGGNAMARDLGFRNMDSLAAWAKENPKIWGNTYGGGMFAIQEAFTPEKKRKAKTLKDIVDHWKEVKIRVEALENVKI